jgi:N-methylhydantoinase A
MDHLGIEAAALEELRIVTTAPLNALLEKCPAKVALLTTRGFADTLQLGRQNRLALYDPVAKSPAPVFLVDPENILEIGGRLDPRGEEVAPLDQADLSRAIATLKDRGIEAVAVCFLFAHVNPAQERRAAEAIGAALPGVTISLSHRVDPAPREYERTVSVLLDAWLAANVAAEVRAMAEAVAARGFRGELLFGDGRGVLVPAQSAEDHRAILLTGAPAVAARAAAALQAPGVTLAVDIGSQSADMSMARAGDPVAAEQGTVAGVPLRIPTVDVASVPLGGARRVRQTARGLRFDGEAGAPTLDDALSVLGRLPAPGAEAQFAGFIEGLTAKEAAQRIVTAAADLMALELTRYATRRNVDPTRAELVVMGGNGPLLAAEIAASMGLTRVSLPRAPGAAGAVGLAGAARRAEAKHLVDRPLEALGKADLDTLLTGLEDEAAGEAPAVYSFTLAALRQMHPMPLVLTERPASAEDIATIFATRYRAAYGITPPGPGHLFQIAVHRDHAEALPPMATLATGQVQGPHLLATEAGPIWVPEGWQLGSDGMAYHLERNAA